MLDLCDGSADDTKGQARGGRAPGCVTCFNVTKLLQVKWPPRKWIHAGSRALAVSSFIWGGVVVFYFFFTQPGGNYFVTPAFQEKPAAIPVSLRNKDDYEMLVLTSYDRLEGWVRTSTYHHALCVSHQTAGYHSRSLWNGYFLKNSYVKKHRARQHVI